MKSLKTFLFLALLAAFASARAAETITPPASDETAAIARAVDDFNADGDVAARRLMARIDKVLSDDPKNVRALKERARMAIKTGWLSNRPAGRNRQRYWVGNFRPGTLQRAEATLLEALEIDSNFAEGYVLLGHVYTQMERVDDASRALRKAEALGSKDPWLHLNWADLDRQTGDKADARARWRKVLADPATPAHPMRAARGFLISQLLEDGNAEEAFALYAQQAAERPDNPYILDGWAMALYGLGRHEEAIAKMRAALAMRDYGIGRRQLAAMLYARWAQLDAQGAPEARSQPFFDEAYAIEPNLDGVIYSAGSMPGGVQAAIALHRKKRRSLDVSGSDRRTALLKATNAEEVGVVKALLEAGANPDLPDDAGWTPLMSAAYYENAEIVRLLLDHGADTRPKRGGRDAAAHALAVGNIELAKLIRAKAATDAATPLPPPK